MRRRKRAVVEMAGQEKWVLRDYVLPQASSISSSIVNPLVEANYFKLSLTLITFEERD